MNFKIPCNSHATAHFAAHSLVALAALASRWSFHFVLDSGSGSDSDSYSDLGSGSVQFAAVLFCFWFQFYYFACVIKIATVCVCVCKRICVRVCVLCLLVIPFLIRPGLDGFSISNLVSISNGSAPSRRASQTESISRAFHSSDSPAIPPAPPFPLATPTA